MEQKHQRGAPAGNRNAVKHGFYCKELTKQERSVFRVAAGMEDISQEIALMRFEIKKAASTGDVDKLVPISKAAYALEKLVRTQQKIFGSEHKKEYAIDKVIREAILPGLTPETALSFLNFQYDKRNVPLETIKLIQKTINRQNEAGLTYNKKQISESV
jgi:hypothetical protein